MAKIAKIFRNDQDQLQFDFEDGTTQTYDIVSLPEEIKVQLLFLGATNKLRDSYSSAGGSCSVARGLLEKAFDNLRNNQWNASRASGGTSSNLLELAEAIAAIKKYEVEAVLQTLESMSPEEIATMRKRPVVKAKIMDIRAKKAKERLKETKGEDFEFAL